MFLHLLYAVKTISRDFHSIQFPEISLQFSTVMVVSLGRESMELFTAHNMIPEVLWSKIFMFIFYHGFFFYRVVKCEALRHSLHDCSGRVYDEGQRGRSRAGTYICVGGEFFCGLT